MYNYLRSLCMKGSSKSVVSLSVVLWLFLFAVSPFCLLQCFADNMSSATLTAPSGSKAYGNHGDSPQPGQITRGDLRDAAGATPSYRENLPSSSVSYADVPADHPNAVYNCSHQGWMSGYLGGNFKPEDCFI